MRSGGGLTPQAQQLLNQVRLNFLNPGNGRIGADALGTGLMGQYGFGGYQRNGQPVGNIAGMCGDAPGPMTGGFQELARLGLFGPSWAAQNWMSDLTNPQNQNARNPYGAAGPGNWLTGEQIGNQYHGGGQGMLDFLRGPQTLQGMDALFSGSGRGGGDVGITMDDNYRY